MTSSGLSAEQHRALTLLASSCHGAHEELLVHGHAFSRDVLASLVRRRFAAAEREVMMAGGKAIEVVRLRITEARRRAVES
jgi:ribosomal protein S3AE